MYFIIVYKFLCYVAEKIKLNVSSMLSNNHTPSDYVSCIKIAGIPILAPLITQERREELLVLKRRAVIVEKRLLERQCDALELKSSSTRKDSGVFTNATSSPKDTLAHSVSNETNFEDSQIISSPSSTSLSRTETTLNVTSRNSLELLKAKDLRETISDDERLRRSDSRVEGSTVDEDLTNRTSKEGGEFEETILDLETTSSSVDDREASAGSVPEINLSLCKELVLRTHFSPLNDDERETGDVKKSSDLHERLTSENAKEVYDETEKNEADGAKVAGDESPKEETQFTPPKLVRQNSYTLDSPSPQLVAYMEKQKRAEPNALSLKRVHTSVSNNEKSAAQLKPFKSKIGRKTRKSWNLEEAKVNWNAHKKMQMNHRKTPKLKRIESTSLTNSCTSSPVEKKVHARSTDCIFSLSANNINNNRSTSNNATIGTTAMPPDRFEKVASPQIEFNTSPSAKRLTYDEALDKSDPANCDRFAKNVCDVATLTPERDVAFNDSSVQSRDSLCKVLYTFGERSAINSSCDDTMSICSSVSLNRYLPSETAMGAHALYMDLKLEHQRQFEDLLKRHELEQQLFLTKLSQVFTSAEAASHQTPPRPVTLNLLPTRLSDSTNDGSAKTTPCRKQLFTGSKCPLDYSEKEKAAATVISAHVKGYLVRRLFRTDRVKQIVLSIKDSISCALKLHTEKDLTPADIDLHGRLIVQMTAGTFALDEILSMPSGHKMAIIRADREKRPVSRPNSGPVLSSATQRVLLRKQQSNCMMKSVDFGQDDIKQNDNQQSRKRERRKSFSCTITNSGSNISSVGTPRQPVQLQKSASTGNSNRQPWR